MTTQITKLDQIIDCIRARFYAGTLPETGEDQGVYWRTEPDVAEFAQFPFDPTDATVTVQTRTLVIEYRDEYDPTMWVREDVPQNVTLTEWDR